jgi:hypothetical protein
MEVYVISQGYEILIAMADEAQDWGLRLGESCRPKSITAGVMVCV